MIIIKLQDTYNMFKHNVRNVNSKGQTSQYVLIVLYDSSGLQPVGCDLLLVTMELGRDILLII